MQNNKGFWVIAERLSLLLTIVIAFPTAIAAALAIWKIVTDGLNATLPAWLLVASILTAFILGYSVGPGKVSILRNRFLKHVELYEVLWAYDKLYKTIDGPFCKICLTRMLPSEKEENYGTRHTTYTIFVCRNPSCKNRGAITHGLGNVSTVEEAWSRVLDQLESAKRMRKLRRPR